MKYLILLLLLPLTSYSQSFEKIFGAPGDDFLDKAIEYGDYYYLFGRAILVSEQDILSGGVFQTIILTNEGKVFTTKIVKIE